MVCLISSFCKPKVLFKPTVEISLINIDFIIHVTTILFQSKSVKHLVGPTYGVYVSDSWFLYKVLYYT